MKVSVAAVLLQASLLVTATPSYHKIISHKGPSNVWRPLSTGHWGPPEPYSNMTMPAPSWGSASTSNTQPWDCPHTGTTRSYNFTVSRGNLAPDGTPRDMILVNGQFPGPMITANWGDWIEVTVNNQISGPDEGTAMHWHGFLQSNSQWSDGSPGTSECPIVPGQSRTYRFQATQYGSSWYHSHYSAQYAAGILGPLIVNGPSNANYDEDLGPVLLSDLYHTPYFQLVEDVMGNDLTKVRPASDNNLINGMACPPTGSNATSTSSTNSSTMAASCPVSSLASFQVTKGKKYRMRLINTSAAAIVKFSIDSHNMTVMAYDYTPIQPTSVTIVTLGVGQRADVIVEANQNSNSAFWIRSVISAGECTEPANERNGWAVLRYDGAGQYATPNSTAQIDDTEPCENDPLDMYAPMYAQAAGNPGFIQNMNVNFSINATGHFNWLMNNQTYHANYNLPVLQLAHENNDTYPLDPQWNANLVQQNTSIRVILENSTPTSHPMHLHGHNMYVLASGNGTWDGSTITNANNPLRRDVHILPALGYSVVQWNLDNPGVWPFHCHIAWHVSGGLQVTYIERPAEILDIKIPQAKFDECSVWNTYSNEVVIDQIDSGMKMVKE